jgi:glycosyltransferase involved in cell wall biosynthesis
MTGVSLGLQESTNELRPGPELEHESSAASVLTSRGRPKTVLMIDYYFPPLAGAGAQRTPGFVRYLMPFGWQPIVMTVQSGDNYFYDPSLVDTIPDRVDVQRTLSFEPLRAARRFLTKPYIGSTRHASGLHQRTSLLGRNLRRLRGLENWLFFPDRHVGWTPFAIGRALRINQRVPIDLVYSTSTAITSHVIAYAVKKILGTPWVADFQDAWAERPGFAKRLFPSPLHAGMARRLEGLILRSADRVVVTADPLRETFERRSKEVSPGKVTVIPMGYDPADFNRAPGVRRRKFTFTHFGNFYAARSPVPFLEALGQCVQAHPDLGRDLDVLFLGTFDSVLRDLALAAVDRWGLSDIVHLEGAVCYEAGVRILKSSDVLVIIGDPGEWHRTAVPTKLYEYFAAGKPILALLPEGPAADILRAAGAGSLVPPHDIGAIRDTIWDFYRRGREGRLEFRASREVTERYAWPKLAGRLAAVFDAVLLAHVSRVARGQTNLVR